MEQKNFKTKNLNLKLSLSHKLTVAPVLADGQNPRLSDETTYGT